MSVIKLTHPERRLRDILVGAANTWPRKPEQIEPLIVRFAGGWVRDKLLDHPNHDIDIALNIATGVQFATHLEKYLETHKVETGEHFHFATISPNVEQSKHLETATANFLDLALDFVNLRSEEYADHSRIPEAMRFGTPKEDAERRDLTINALFYNLHTERVEDFTGWGLRDVEDGIIRTPLDPLTTFKDDPLRVLRAVRFATRLNFQIVPEIKNAVLDQEVKYRLRSHVTIPRKAEEIKKLLKRISQLESSNLAPHTMRALELIEEYRLYSHIFTLSPRDQTVDPAHPKRRPLPLDPITYSPHPASESVAAGKLVTYLLQHQIAQFLNIEQNEIPWIMAGLAPWRGLLHPNPVKKEPKYVASLIAKHELMYGEHVRDVVEDTFEKGKMEMIKEAVTNNDDQPLSRQDAVVLIRRLGHNWRMITFTLILYELVPLTLTQKTNFDRVLEMYVSLLERIYSHGVENAYKVTRLIPGNELATLLGGLQARQISEAQEKAVIYQIVHHIHSREQMEKAVKNREFKYP